METPIFDVRLKGGGKGAEFNLDFQSHLKLNCIFFKLKPLTLSLDSEKAENFASKFVLTRDLQDQVQGH